MPTRHDRRPHDRRLGSHQHDVARQQRQRDQGRAPPRHHDRQQGDRGSQQQRHVLPGNDEQVRRPRAPQVVLEAGWHGALAAEQHPCRQRCLGFRQRTLDVVERPTPQAQQRIGDIVAGVAFEECPALGEGRDGVDAPRAQERRVVEVVEGAARARSPPLPRCGRPRAAARAARAGSAAARRPRSAPSIDSTRRSRRASVPDSRGSARTVPTTSCVPSRVARSGCGRPSASPTRAWPAAAVAISATSSSIEDASRRTVAAGHGHHRRREHRDEERCPPRPAEQRPAHGARDEARRHERQRREQRA